MHTCLSDATRLDVVSRLRIRGDVFPRDPSRYTTTPDETKPRAVITGEYALDTATRDSHVGHVNCRASRNTASGIDE